MKRITWLCVAVLLVVSSAGAVYHFTGSLRQTTCEICGKTIEYWEEDSSVFSGIYMSSGSSFVDSRRYLAWSITVCGECESKYRKELAGMIDNWLVEKQEIHKEERLANKEARKQAEIERLKQQIKEVQDKLRELK